MAFSKATLKYLIGINSDISSNVFYLDERTIFYTCGCYCVFFNTEQKTMRFLIASEKGAEITAMAVSPRRNYSAVALNSEKPSVNILDLLTKRKIRTLVCQVLHCKIVSLSFSSTSRYLVAICDDPSRTLLYWSWKRSKLLLSTKVTVSVAPEILHCVSFNPQTHLNVYVFGNKFLKLFRFEGCKNKQFNFPTIVPQDFKCYCWDANQRLLVGTGSGRVLFIEDKDLRLDFNVFQYTYVSDESVKSYGVTAITSYSKGFITACGKCVHFFERIEAKDTYKFVRSVFLPSDGLEKSDLCDQIIKWMMVNPSDDVLAISTNMKQLYSTKIYPRETKHTNKVIVFDVLVHPFHYKSVTGCCVCLWKPFFATSSLDGSIKLWNYKTCSLEFSRDFSSEVYSISVHPMGLFLLAGFSDKLRFMYIRKNDFKQFKEFDIRMCTHCNFSRGGHMFAAVSNRVILVYSAINFEKLAKLKGHNGKIQTTVWCVDDNNLISCDMDGAVYEWEIRTEKRICQCILKSCSHHDLTINFDKKLYVVDSDYSLKEIYKSHVIRTLLTDKVLFTSIALSWSNTMLFVGTNNGHIRSLEYPVTLSGKYLDYPCHSLETTHVIFTPDDRYLISTSTDSSIAIWNVTDFEGRNFKRDMSTIWTEEVLIPSEKLKAKNSSILNLKLRVENLSNENSYQLYLRDISYNDKIKEICGNYIQEKENLETKNEILASDKVRENAKYDKQMAKLVDSHCTEVESLNRASDRKLLDECEKLKTLRTRLTTLLEEQEQEEQDMVEKHEHLEKQLREEYKKKFEDLEKEIGQYEEEILIKQKEHNKAEKQIERDAEVEYINKKTEYEKQLYIERHANFETRDQNDILRKKLLAFPKELKESEDECHKHKMEVKRLNIVKNNLEKDVHHLLNELEIQCQGLNDEERRFFDLKLTNHNIDVSKCELECKNITELKRQIEARETAIDNLKKQVSAMETELGYFTRQFVTMGQSIAETKEKLVAASQELDQVRTMLHKKTAVLNSFCSDLFNCMTFIREPQKLKNNIKSLYRNYIARNDDKIVVTDPGVQMEWSRQRNHFEYTIHKVKHQLNSTTKQVSRDTNRLLTKCNYIGEILQKTRYQNYRLHSILGGAK
ncbi:cilia- and flagella-associated protein 57 [Octopus bimaculoides]|uniref:Cilia- and flagella-associated protein 57 n=1 Tax=Octopus bimaculoides TaxID=37653 RepID=A0A0L8FYE3_OCTBM|nr:cilia- and flagella-associated protein 57 [Octopus bimaculoides]|eukprot:XP_014785723.1 PREDICTED: cilia- and flagella-associated protein 57-like [Octopus bimaculoides]